ncbi:MAG: PD-(D/E)XK nuclease family protein, partial [Actinomycetota bacterium]|nr:PD-(D/E)XK nuclease family protein [Actinomycetota bacterium]
AGVPARAGPVAQRVRSALRSPLLRAAAERRHWKEVFVSARLDGRHVEGFVDLLVEEPDGSLTVVDYKTDRVDDDATLAAKVEQYTPQLAAYASAVRVATGRAVDRVALLFCQPDRAVEQRITLSRPGSAGPG